MNPRLFGYQWLDRCQYRGVEREDVYHSVLLHYHTTYTSFAYHINGSSSSYGPSGAGLFKPNKGSSMVGQQSITRLWNDGDPDRYQPH
jgi:hypothetical protein